MHWWILDVALLAFGLLVLVAAGLTAFGKFKVLKGELAVTNARVAEIQAAIEALPLPHG